MVHEKDTLVFLIGKKIFKRFTSQRDRERIYNYQYFSKLYAKKKVVRNLESKKKKKSLMKLKPS